MLENAQPVAGVPPKARAKEVHELEFRRMSLASAIEVLLDDYRKAGGKLAPRRRRKKIGKLPNDYHP